MRMRNLFFVALMALLSTVPVRAGLYVLAEPISGPLPAEPQFYRGNVLGPMQSLVSTVPEVLKRPLPTRVREETARLSSRVREGLAGIDDYINLGGYLCWQARYDEAVAVLRAASQKAPSNAFVLANLATAYQGTNNYLQAYTHLDLALKNWPAAVPGWTRDQVNWFHRAEQFHLALLGSRRQEQLGGRTETGLDPIFNGVRLDSPTRKFQPGELDAATRRLVPPDALGIVQQLLLWMPHDNRLIWLYAELLNGHGEIEIAYDLMKEVEDARRHENVLLRRHRRVLGDAVPIVKKFTLEAKYEILYCLSPRVGVGMGGGAVAYEAGRTEALGQARKVLNPVPEMPNLTPADNNQGPGTQIDVLPNWKHIAIGFAAGVLVGMLLVLQLRQMFRRSPSRA